jgi:hypothetical protein
VHTQISYSVATLAMFDESIFLSLSKEAKLDETVKHALAVHSAVSSGNYVMFFKLYKKAPGLNSCLMGKDDIYCPLSNFFLSI